MLRARFNAFRIVDSVTARKPGRRNGDKVKKLLHLLLFLQQISISFLLSFPPSSANDVHVTHCNSSAGSHRRLPGVARRAHFHEFARRSLSGRPRSRVRHFSPARPPLAYRARGSVRRLAKLPASLTFSGCHRRRARGRWSAEGLVPAVVARAAKHLGRSVSQK